MFELIEKKKELEGDINDIEISCQSLLNYGNVPNENWEEVFRKLLIRKLKKAALNEVEDVIETINSNLK